MRTYTVVLIVVAFMELAIQSPVSAADSPKRATGSQTTTIDIGGVRYTLPFTMPAVTDVRREHSSTSTAGRTELVECELVSFKRHDQKFYPLVGRARLIEVQFKCTTATDGRTEVVYVDRDHLVLSE